MKRHEAKSTPAADDEENNTQAEEEHRGQENEDNKEIDQSSDKEGHGNTEAPSRATCDKDLEGVKLKTMISHAATMMDEPEEEQEPCDEIPDTTFSVGASVVLSNRPNEDTVEGKTQEQEEAEFHVNSSVADLGGKYNTCGNLAGKKVASPNSSGLDSSVPVPLGDNRLLPAAEGPDRGTEEGGAPGRTAGKGEEEEKDKDGASKVEMRSFPNTQGAMSDEDQEVEVVEDDQEVQVVDMSLEDRPPSPEEAGANARSPSPSPDSPTRGSLGFCRDELYETSEEAEMLLDEAEDGEEGQRSPPYVVPGSRSPSPRALAAVYTQVRGASDLSPATLESLERGRMTMEEVTRRAARTRLILDKERRDKESREERSRSRSRPRRQEQQRRGEEALPIGDYLEPPER